MTLVNSMKLYEITYSPNEYTLRRETYYVRAVDEKSALEAFSFRHDTVPSDHIWSVALTTSEKAEGVKTPDEWPENPQLKETPENPQLKENNEKSTPSYFLGFFGILISVVGCYFLFLEPGVETAGGLVNMHRLAVGQTLMIIGAIFIAAQWRPR